MSKILASDYDGTLCQDGIVAKASIEALKHWKSKGNHFGLVTGRDIRMARQAVEVDRLPIDFLVCNNGCVIFNKQYERLWNRFLEEDDIAGLLDSSQLKESDYIILSGEKERFLYDESYSPGKYPGLYYTKVLKSREELKGLRFYQIDTRYASLEKIREISAGLTRQFGSRVTVNPNIDTIDITPVGVNKLAGLKTCCELFHYDLSKVLTVGDGLNDLTMIDYFNGYTVPGAEAALKDRAREIVPTVAEIIEKHC